LPSLREYISHSYGQARWLHELLGMAADPESDKWADEVRTIRIPQKHVGTAVGTSRHGAPHCITSVLAGSRSMIARNGNALVGERITHVDSIQTITMSLHRALQGPEYTSVSLGIADPHRNAQTIPVLRSPPKTSQISWARAVKPLRDRRRELERPPEVLSRRRILSPRP